MDRETVMRPLRLAQLVRAGVSFSDALAGHRILGREDRTILGTVAIIAISAAVVVVDAPALRPLVAAVALLELELKLELKDDYAPP